MRLRRIETYGAHDCGRNGIDDRVDSELIGFTFRETVNFVRVWHKDHPEVADRLLSALTDCDELEQLAEVPLLLSFFCRLTDPFG